MDTDFQKYVDANFTNFHEFKPGCSHWRQLAKLASRLNRRQSALLSTKNLFACLGVASVRSRVLPALIAVLNLLPAGQWIDAASITVAG